MINNCLEFFELDARSFVRISRELGQQNSSNDTNFCVLGAPNLHNFLYDMYQSALRWAESVLRFHGIVFVVSWSGRGVVTPPILAKPIVSSW